MLTLADVVTYFTLKYRSVSLWIYTIHHLYSCWSIWRSDLVKWLLFVTFSTFKPGKEQYDSWASRPEIDVRGKGLPREHGLWAKIQDSWSPTWNTEGGEDVSQMCDCPGGGGGMKQGGGSCGSSSTWLLAVKTVRWELHSEVKGVKRLQHVVF